GGRGRTGRGCAPHVPERGQVGGDDHATPGTPLARRLGFLAARTGHGTPPARRTIVADCARGVPQGRPRDSARFWDGADGHVPGRLRGDDPRHECLRRALRSSSNTRAGVSGIRSTVTPYRAGADSTAPPLRAP